jgi:hypothetical protein
MIHIKMIGIVRCFLARCGFGSKSNLQGVPRRDRYGGARRRQQNCTAGAVRASPQLLPLTIAKGPSVILKFYFVGN